MPFRLSRRMAYGALLVVGVAASVVGILILTGTLFATSSSALPRSEVDALISHFRRNPGPGARVDSVEIVRAARPGIGRLKEFGDIGSWLGDGSEPFLYLEVLHGRFSCKFIPPLSCPGGSRMYMATAEVDEAPTLVGFGDREPNLASLGHVVTITDLPG